MISRQKRRKNLNEALIHTLERDLEKLDHSMYRTVRFKEVETQLKEALFALEEKMLINNSQPIRRMIKYKFEMFDEIPYKQ